MTMTSNMHSFLCSPSRQQHVIKSSACTDICHSSGIPMRKFIGRMGTIETSPLLQTNIPRWSCNIKLNLNYKSVTVQQNSRKVTALSNFFSIQTNPVCISVSETAFSFFHLGEIRVCTEIIHWSICLRLVLPPCCLFPLILSQNN